VTTHRHICDMLILALSVTHTHTDTHIRKLHNNHRHNVTYRTNHTRMSGSDSWRRKRSVFHRTLTNNCSISSTMAEREKSEWKEKQDSTLPKLPHKSLKYSFYNAQPSPRSETCKRLKGKLLFIWQCKARTHFQ